MVSSSGNGEDFLGAPETREITELPAAWSGGDEAACAQLVPLVYAARSRLRQKHGSDAPVVTLEDAPALSASPAADFVALDAGTKAAKAWPYAQFNRGEGGAPLGERICKPGSLDE